MRAAYGSGTPVALLPGVGGRKKRRDLRGARSITSDDGNSFVDDEGHRGRSFSGGRKVTEQEQVGISTPDSDPEPPSQRPHAR